MFDRHDRASSILRELIASYVQGEANPDPLITITHVTVASNYKNATVYFTTIPDSGEADALIFLKRKASDIRTHLKKHASLRGIPHLEFEVDRGERHRQNIDRISSELKASENLSETD